MPISHFHNIYISSLKQFHKNLFITKSEDLKSVTIRCVRSTWIEIYSI